MEKRKKYVIILYKNSGDENMYLKDKINRPPCPECGSHDIAFIMWGHPIFDDMLQEKLNRNEVTLGGCFISKDCNRWLCNNCGARFEATGTLPLKIETKEPLPITVTAYDKTFINEKKISTSKKCGCFNCKRVFSPEDISLWIDDLHQQRTALCPYCNMDTVIPETGDIQITTELLENMNEYWIKKHN